MILSPFQGRELLVDNSAFQRGGQPAVREEWRLALEGGVLHRSPILDLEVLYSARKRAGVRRAEGGTEALRPLELSHASAEAALRAQADLARHAAGFQRLPPQDYFVAAVAATHGVGVLHYDGDFDRLARDSSLAFDSVWLAPAGTLDQELPDPLREHPQALGLGLAQFDGVRATEILDRVLDFV